MGDTSCTVGYVDPKTNRVYTAAHCVGKPGMVVYDKNWKPIGKVEHKNPNYRYNPANHKANHDTATVKLYPQHSAGKNGYSGDRVISHRDVRYSDTVCHYGKTSKKVSCGKVRGKEHNVILTGGSQVKPGDSGGPAWVPGKGFIGVATAAWYQPHPNGYSAGFTGLHQEPGIKVSHSPQQAPKINMPGIPVAQPVGIQQAVDNASQQAHKTTDDVANQLKTQTPIDHGFINHHQNATHKAIDDIAGLVR